MRKMESASVPRARQADPARRSPPSSAGPAAVPGQPMRSPLCAVRALPLYVLAKVLDFFVLPNWPFTTVLLPFKHVKEVVSGTGLH